MLEQGSIKSGAITVRLADALGNIVEPAASTFSSIGDGRKTVTTAGTAEALAGSTACKKVVIMAMIANTGNIVVGGSSVVAAEATRQGISLMAGASVQIEIDNLNKIYLDSEVNGEGVTFIYYS